MRRMLSVLVVLALSFALTISFAACGGGSGETSAPEESTPQETQATIGAGPIVEDMTFDELDAALTGFGLDRNSTTSDDVAAFLGVYGLVDEEWSDSRIAVSWYASDDGFATIFFDKETGLYASWSTSGYGRP